MPLKRNELRRFVAALRKEEPGLSIRVGSQGVLCLWLPKGSSNLPPVPNLLVTGVTKGCLEGGRGRPHPCSSAEKESESMAREETPARRKKHALLHRKQSRRMKGKDRGCFMYGFYYHLNSQRFKQSHDINDYSAAHVVSCFVSSELLKCRLLKLLLDHPMNVRSRGWRRGGWPKSRPLKW